MLTLNGPFGLDKTRGKMMGVCAGLADYTRTEAVWWRIGFVAAALLGVGAPVLIYVVIGLVADTKRAI